MIGLGGWVAPCPAHVDTARPRAFLTHIHVLFTIFVYTVRVISSQVFLWCEVSGDLP